MRAHERHERKIQFPCNKKQTQKIYLFEYITVNELNKTPMEEATVIMHG